MCLMFLNLNCLYSFRAIPFGKSFARLMACNFSAFATADRGVIFPCPPFSLAKDFRTVPV